MYTLTIYINYNFKYINYYLRFIIYNIKYIVKSNDVVI